MPKGIYIRTDEHKKKLKENFGNEVGFGYWTGKPRSEETKKKLREFRIGKLASPETKKKMSLAHMGKNTGKDNYWFGKQSPKVNIDGSEKMTLTLMKKIEPVIEPNESNGL